MSCGRTGICAAVELERPLLGCARFSRTGAPKLRRYPHFPARNVLRASIAVLIPLSRHGLRSPMPRKRMHACCALPNRRGSTLD